MHNYRFYSQPPSTKESKEELKKAPQKALETKWWLIELTPEQDPPRYDDFMKWVFNLKKVDTQVNRKAQKDLVNIDLNRECFISIEQCDFDTWRAAIDTMAENTSGPYTQGDFSGDILRLYRFLAEFILSTEPEKITDYQFEKINFAYSSDEKIDEKIEKKPASISFMIFREHPEYWGWSVRRYIKDTSFASGFYTAYIVSDALAQVLQVQTPEACKLLGLKLGTGSLKTFLKEKINSPSLFGLLEDYIWPTENTFNYKTGLEELNTFVRSQEVRVGGCNVSLALTGNYNKFLARWVAEFNKQNFDDSSWSKYLKDAQEKLAAAGESDDRWRFELDVKYYQRQGNRQVWLIDYIERNLVVADPTSNEAVMEYQNHLDTLARLLVFVEDFKQEKNLYHFSDSDKEKNWPYTLSEYYRYGLQEIFASITKHSAANSLDAIINALQKNAAKLLKEFDENFSEDYAVFTKTEAFAVLRDLVATNNKPAVMPPPEFKKF